jgi:iron complex outermembrane receptor protein
MAHDLAGTWSRAGLLVGVSLGALMGATPAPAQTTPQNPETVTDQAIQGPNVPTPAPEKAIVITGTRIKQPEFTSPDPVSSIDPTLSKREGKMDTADTLQSSPIAPARRAPAAAFPPSTSTCFRNRS